MSESRNRRQAYLLPLLLMAGLGLATLAVPFIVQKVYAQKVYAEPGEKLHEARYYRKLADGEVECRLCPRECLLRPGEIGDCQVKVNRKGTLYSLVYGRPCSLSVEPIEKAPFYHFLPGSWRLCLATVGCNLRCKYCQNWQISQAKVEEVESAEMSPEQVVALALRNNVRIICFTFSEPIAFYEYMYDIAELARRAGLKTAMVSNGYINPKPLEKLLDVMDAVKIDLKAFTEDFYEEINLGELEPVLEAIKIIRRRGVWLELVNLVVPTLNDDPREITAMCGWISKELGDEVPLHFTRFFPQYRLTNLPPTPIESLEKAYSLAKAAGLKYVYIGNVPGHRNNSTFCPGCGKVLIQRIHFDVPANNLKAGKCPYCGMTISGYW